MDHVCANCDAACECDAACVNCGAHCPVPMNPIDPTCPLPDQGLGGPTRMEPEQ